MITDDDKILEYTDERYSLGETLFIIFLANFAGFSKAKGFISEQWLTHLGDAQGQQIWLMKGIVNVGQLTQWKIRQWSSLCQNRSSISMKEKRAGSKKSGATPEIIDCSTRYRRKLGRSPSHHTVYRNQYFTFLWLEIDLHLVISSGTAPWGSLSSWI